MYIFIILNVVSTTNCQDLQIFPDIADIFDTFKEPTAVEQVEQDKNVIIRNISIDVEKVDIEKLKRKLNISEEVSFPTFNDTRRLDRYGSWFDWGAAAEYEVKLKTLDVMLQFVYMARHKIKRLESERYFNPKDTSYRISYLNRRLIRLYTEMNNIYGTMWKIKKRQSVSMERQLFLHHKVAKLHVDFLYLWWVLVKIHYKYSLAHGIPNVVPDIYTPSVFATACANQTLITAQPPNKNNLTQVDISDETALDYVFGNESNDNIEFSLLECESFKDITRTALALRRSITREEVLHGREKYTPKILELMQQSIYATRYRMEDTRRYRIKYRNDPAYKAAIFYGAILEIRYKLDRLFNTLRNFGKRTKFIWYLVIYERIVQAHVDVSDMVDRIYQIRKEFKSNFEFKDDDEMSVRRERVGEPSVNVGDF